MRNRVTFKALVALPDEYGADELEVIVAKLIKFFESGEMGVLNVTWSCTTLGRKSTPPSPVLVFSKEE